MISRTLRTPTGCLISWKTPAWLKINGWTVTSWKQLNVKLFQLVLIICIPTWEFSVLTVERLEAFIPQLFSVLHVESLVYGNVDKESALKLVNLVEKKLAGTQPLKPPHLLRAREICLEDGIFFLHTYIQFLSQTFQAATMFTRCPGMREALAFKCICRCHANPATSGSARCCSFLFTSPKSRVTITCELRFIFILKKRSGVQRFWIHLFAGSTGLHCFPVFCLRP